jgi:DNA polymerase-4
MDAFFASVEQRDAPELQGKPVIVGGPSKRGVVLAASYEVRAFGVRSAMSMAEALRRAPGAIVVSPRHERYEQVSERTLAIFRRYTPMVEPLSLDEAFLDVSASRELFGDGATIGQAVRRDVFEELGLAASAGVASSKFAAKVASDLAKPNALLVVPPDVAAFLAPLPIERMWGAGPKTAPRMRAAGYATLGDLARADPLAVERSFGAWGAHAVLLARGEDPREVDSHASARSIGAERTYDDDRVGPAAVGHTFLAHAARVARRLVSGSLCARTVVIKVKYADFTIRTRRMTLTEPVQDTDSIHRTALELLARIPLEGRRVRLTGVSVCDLIEGPPPRLLVGDARTEKNRRVEEVALQIADRFPDRIALTRAALLEKDRR